MGGGAMKGKRSRAPETSPIFIIGAAAILIAIVLMLRGCGGCSNKNKTDKGEQPLNTAANTAASNALQNPVRPKPESFPRNTYMPNVPESTASGSIASVDFSAGRDLVFVDDDRVWWESDNDGDTDDECDHSMHVAIVEPFKRLSNLVAETKWKLKVQECYRATGTHATKSLHKQGRAIDVTVGHHDNPDDKLPAEEMRVAYEELAKLAWQAGFDWVYYEYKSTQGPHVHASVKASRKDEK